MPAAPVSLRNGAPESPATHVEGLLTHRGKAPGFQNTAYQETYPVPASTPPSPTPTGDGSSSAPPGWQQRPAGGRGVGGCRGAGWSRSTAQVRCLSRCQGRGTAGAPDIAPRCCGVMDRGALTAQWGCRGANNAVKGGDGTQHHVPLSACSWQRNGPVPAAGCREGSAPLAASPGQDTASQSRRASGSGLGGCCSVSPPGREHLRSRWWHVWS